MARIYKKIMKKIITLFTIMISLLIVLKNFLQPQYMLVIENKTNKQKYEFILKNKEFSLGYIHSVMKTEAEEVFVADENKKIKLMRTEYSSYGVGLPFLQEEGKLKIKDGKFILEMERDFKNIPMFISPIGKHYLKIDGRKYMLSEILGNKPTQILLTIKKDYKF